MGAPKGADFEHISIHALLAESDAREESDQRHLPDISIHALLAESDNAHLYYHSRGLNISIHALLAESDSESV